MAENKVDAVDDSDDYSRWMENLPNEKQLIPLTDLVIPGSHDSGTFFLDKNMEIGPDEPPKIRAFGRLSKRVKSIVHNWSVTQSMTIYHQLTSGIRYLDLRVAYRAEDNEIHIYCTRVLDDVNRFVAKYPKEIVILDFNHFYDMDTATHETLADMLIAKFGKILRAPGEDGPKVTLQEMWGKAETIIIIYHNTDVVSAHPSFWSGSKQFISSRWPNTADGNTLMHFLKEHSAASRFSDDAFHVTQAILTPKTTTIIKNFRSTLKDGLARKCNSLVTKWLKTLITTKSHKYKFNIIIADFVEIVEFIPTVIRLNSF
ncbi:PI-PLC X domain-containing protein 2 [Desmophyllum pertusum]|uniref:PI-PLC X domain-containing protein 2 n=1 Tax=Desmophyllum pertusum TaxID=174260 RepID=A0A9W9ZAW7_9CNID|nr:PI-PLC X domain-containing protein 2 [Desmophyllum pertusum]